ncbi:MAG: helix-turn-helix transcriptional regulator [Pseudomonadota bacterium]
MPIQIALDHPTRLLKNKIQEVSKNFLGAFGFSYFQYLRCFANGSASLLTNNTGPFELMAEMENTPVIFSSYEEEHEKAHSYWFLWDEELPEFPVGIARERFNVHCGLTLVRRSKTYYDMIAVGLPNDVANPAGFYLNKLHAIEQFVKEFDYDNKDLIECMNKNPIALPKPYRDVNYQDICLTEGKIVVAGKTGMTHITAQELACLRLLLQGSPLKKIARTLAVSPRTVETYLQRIRLRTGFATRAELERMMSLCSAG